MKAESGSERGRGIETLIRAQQVASWLVEGLDRREVQARARELWDLAPRSVDRLLAVAREQLIEAWQMERPELLAVLLSRCDRVYREAMAAGNHNAALGAINTAQRLAQL